MNRHQNLENFGCNPQQPGTSNIPTLQGHNYGQNHNPQNTHQYYINAQNDVSNGRNSRHSNMNPRIFCKHGI